MYNPSGMKNGQSAQVPYTLAEVISVVVEDESEERYPPKNVSPDAKRHVQFTRSQR